MISSPDFPELFQNASGQLGYFTADQAREQGITRMLLHYHIREGKIIRIYRGVYRFRDYPPTMREEVAAAWLAVDKDHAVVSHQSALDLLEISDIIPNAIDITIPRSKRYLVPPDGITLHTSTRPLDATDITYRNGIKITSATRTIVDVAEAGLSGEHVERAVAEALQAGMTSARRLRNAAANRSRRVQRMIEQAIDMATS
jgi:predicted transcriptional regulator of viral defense system